MMRNKKAWIKIVEAFVAVLMITGVILISSGGGLLDGRLSSNIHDSQISILREIQSNNTLRQEIVDSNGIVEWGNFPEKTKNKIIGRTPSYLECEAKICPPSEGCVLTDQQEKSVYAESVIISSSLETFKLRMLKLFCWEE